jgi:uncharacterized membrane protein
MNNREWVLKRNCSLSPRQLAFAYAVLCLTSFLVAAIFAFRGMWYVLAFATLEMASTALAFIIYARHATDQEHIALTEECLLIGRVLAGRVEQTRLAPYWTHVALPCSARDLINLEARGVRVEVGRFVTVEKRRKVAQELRQELRNGVFIRSDF